MWILPLLFVAGAGLGLFVRVAVLAGQNDVTVTDLGVATGALSFSKTLGGAIGAAAFGAILTAGLHHDPRPGTATYVHAYHTVFLWTVPFMILAFILAILMREKPLSAEMLEVVKGRIEVPEY